MTSLPAGQGRRRLRGQPGAPRPASGLLPRLQAGGAARLVRQAPGCALRERQAAPAGRSRSGGRAADRVLPNAPVLTAAKAIPSYSTSTMCGAPNATRSAAGLGRAIRGKVCSRRSKSARCGARTATGAKRRGSRGTGVRLCWVCARTRRGRLRRSQLKRRRRGGAIRVREGGGPAPKQPWCRSGRSAGTRGRRF